MHHPAATASGQSSSVLLKIQLTGRSLAEHSRQEALLVPGDLIVFDTDKPHRLTLLEDSEMLAFNISKDTTGDLLARAESLVGLRIPGAMPAGRLCREYARNLWRQCQAEGGPSLTADTAQELCKMIADCCATRTLESQRPRRAVWSQIDVQLREYIHDPDLTIARMSDDLGISPRRLQQIFAARGTTPARYVLEERLKEARHRLASPKYRQLSVMRIALDVGFGDITYFGRAFRARYRTTPLAFRRSTGNH